jgi:hypothetical protein
VVNKSYHAPYALIALIIADQFEPRLPRDPLATVKRLIEVLDSQELAAAIRRTDGGSGLKIVK